MMGVDSDNMSNETSLGDGIDFIFTLQRIGPKEKILWRNVMISASSKQGSFIVEGVSNLSEKQPASPAPVLFQETSFKTSTSTNSKNIRYLLSGSE